MAKKYINKKTLIGLYKTSKKISKIKFEFILNYWLLINNYRNIFQIYRKNNKGFNTIKKLCNEYNITYTIVSNRFIIYNNHIKYHQIDWTFGKKFAQQLGKFYIYPTNNIIKLNKLNSTKRIIILCKNKKNINIELYAQLCPKHILQKNINIIFNVIKNIRIIYKKLDKNIITELLIQK